MKRTIQLCTLALLTLGLGSSQAAIRISEVFANTPDGQTGREFVEIRGNANESLANLWLVVLEGVRPADGGNPGRCVLVANLGAQTSLPANGLLIVKAATGGHAVPTGTKVIGSTSLNAPNDRIPNPASSVLIVQLSSGTPTENTDYDTNNDGVLDVAPLISPTIIDAVAWRGSTTAGDRQYGTVRIDQADGRPDAATRYPNDERANNAAAWYYGDVVSFGLGPRSLEYTTTAINRSAIFPATGAFLTPGAPNEPNDTPGSGFVNTTPSMINQILPTSGDVFDTNPKVTLSINTGIGTVSSLTAVSSDQGIVPDSRISVSSAGGNWNVTINPVGFGVNAIITLTPNGDLTRRRSFLYAASRAGAIAGGTTLFHMGASDASSGIALSVGTEAWVADDEYNALKRYKRTFSSNYVSEVNFSGNLALGAGNQEVDQEASARYTASGGIERIFWLGSHANDADSPYGDMPNRARIYATTLNTANNSLTFGQYFSALLTALSGFNPSRYDLGNSMAAGVDPRAANGSGLNIEGFALTADNPPVGYIGFRAPLVPALPTRGSLALIAPINNIEAVVMAGTPNSVNPSFNNGIELNLGGRGIRSIDRVGSTYLIVAGLPGAGHYNGNAWTPTNNAIFTWDGNTTTPGITEWAADLIGRNVEGLMDLPGSPIGFGSQFRVIEDNGTNDFYGTGTRAKDLPYPGYKKSRSFTVTLSQKASVTYNYSLLWHSAGESACCGSLSQLTYGESEGFAINNSETITGISHGYNNQYFIGFLWSQEPPWNGFNWQQLGSNGGQGYDVNNWHQAVGWWLNSGIMEGKVWDFGSDPVTSTALYPTADTVPRGINENGIAVGSFQTSVGSVVNAFYWNGEDFIGISGLHSALFGGSFPNLTIAHGINNRNQIVGSSGLSGGVIRACVWEPHPAGGYYAATNLPTLPSGGNNEALAINDNGTIVGYAINSAGYRRACAWAKVAGNYEIFDLGILPTEPADRHSEAKAINNRGQIVGYCTSANGYPNHAVTWINGRIIHLGSRTSNLESGLPGQGGQAWLTSANGINDTGTITGQVYRNGAISPCNQTCYKAYVLWAN